MRDLTKGNEAKLIINFALPMLFGNVFQQLYNIIDSIIVGKVIGKEALAAVGTTFPIFYAYIALIIGFGSGATVIISQFFGAGQMNNVRKTIYTFFTVLIIAGIALSLLGIYFTDPIFQLLKLPPAVYGEAKTYFTIFMSGMILFFGFNGISSVLRGLGDSKTPLYFMIISTILNIILDLLFVMVFKWGVAGAAWATLISHGFAFLAGAVYLHRTHPIISFNLKSYIFDKKIFHECLRIGLPTGFQQTFVAFGMMALLGIVNTFGTDVLAAYTAAGRIDSIAQMPAMNFTSALAAFVGQNLGARKLHRIKKGFWVTLGLTSIISISGTLLVIFFSDPLMSLFTNDPAVIEIGKQYLVIVSSFYICFSSMFTTYGVLRGAGDTLIPMFLTLFSLWIIRIPLAMTLSKQLGSDGIWWAIPAGWGAGMVVSYLYFLSGRWKNKGVIKSTTPD